MTVLSIPLFAFFVVFRSAWPSMSDEKGFADRVNGMPKYVATRGSGTPEWNATFLTGDLAEAVAGLKATGQALLLNGSGGLVNQLAAAGKRLFDQRAAGVKLTPAGGWTSASGVAVLTYQPGPS